MRTQYSVMLPAVLALNCGGQSTDIDRDGEPDTVRELVDASVVASMDAGVRPTGPTTCGNTGVSPGANPAPADAFHSDAGRDTSMSNSEPDLGTTQCAPVSHSDADTASDSPNTQTTSDRTDEATSSSNDPEVIDGGAPTEPMPPLPVAEGWRWENPLPFGVSLYTSWVFSPTDVWVGGELGTVAHRNADEWQVFNLSPSVSVTSLWGSASSDVWAGTSNGLWHWDGENWSFVRQSAAPVAAVWGVDSADVWAAAAALLHWDGEGWAEVALPLDGSVTGLWGSGPQDVWATVDAAEPEVWGVLHYDGKDWSSVLVDDDVAVELLASPGKELGVSGTSSQDVWILRQELGGFSPELAAWHYDGESWTKTLAGNGEARQLLATADGAAWLLDIDGNLSRSTGGAFVAVEPALAVADTLALATLPVAQPSAEPGALWAVGRAGLIASWDGSAWTELSAGERADVESLNPVESQVWALGTGYWDAAGNPDLRLGPLPLLSGANSEALPPAIVDLWAPAADDIWAIGRRTLHHFDGNDWSTLDESGADHQAIWAASADDIWIVGDRTLWRGDGTTWDKQNLNYVDVDGTRADDVWLVIGSTATHFDGKSWQDHELPELNLFGVAAFESGAFVVGRGGAAVYRAGEWTVSAMDVDLYAVQVIDANEAWAVGELASGDVTQGVVAHFAAGVWEAQLLGVDVPLRAIAADAERIWVSGPRGALLSRAR